MLSMQRGAVSTTDRPLAVEPRPIRQNRFLQISSSVYPVQRRQIQSLSAAGHVQQVVGELLALLKLAQQSKCLQGIV